MGQSLNARRVLVVDDNTDAADLLGELICLEGHIVFVAHGGLEALAAAEKFLPDIVFLDIGMPGMDGYEVAVELRRNPALRRARIVALTAWGDEASRARAAACGFDAHVVKPAVFDHLMNEVILTRVASGCSNANIERLVNP
jgi:CheY-like chemotaxis protein